MLKDYIKGCSAELIDGKHIDVAIEVDMEIFTYFGGKNQIVDNDYLYNDFGTFYLRDDNTCWFWAITNKTLNSRVKDRIGKFYLTDSETSNRIETRTRIMRYFKKLVEPMLDKEIKRFYKVECKYYV